MARSLSNLVNNHSEGIHKIKLKYKQDDKKCETCRIKYKYWDCFLEQPDFKGDLVEYIYLYCHRIYQHKFDEKLKKSFFNRNEFLTMAIMSLFYCCRKVFILPKVLIKDTSQFHEDFITTYNEESDEGHFLEVDVQYLEKLHELHNDLPFLLERMKIEKS